MDVSWPKVIDGGGQVTEQVGHVIDLMATCIDAAGHSYPEEFHGRRPLPLEGKSLLPVFHGRQRAGHELLGWRVPQNQVARAGKWKVIRRDGGPWELYDLEADGTETNNLADRFPDITKDLAEKWHRWAERCQQEEAPR